MNTQVTIGNSLNTDYTNDYEMSPKTLIRIWNNLQRKDAKTAMFKIDRKKTELTKAEIINKLVQFGKVIRYKNIAFFVDPITQWYCLTIGKQRIYNASIGDFYDIIDKIYKVNVRKQLGIA